MTKKDKLEMKAMIKEAMAGSTETTEATLKTALEAQTALQNTNTFNTSVSDLSTVTPGFSDFLSDKDDFNRVRTDQLNAIESLEDRHAALKHLHKVFVESHPIGSGGIPVAQKKDMDKSAEKIDTILEDFNQGKFDKNPDEFQKNYFAAVSDDINLFQPTP